MKPLRFGSSATADVSTQNVAAWLKLIRWCEGTLDVGDDGYRMLFGGALFRDFKAHPQQRVTQQCGSRTICSTAAGAYQIRAATWGDCVKARRLLDFSPVSQDRAAIYLTERRRALDAVRSGRIETALELCRDEWASFPSSRYAQATVSLHDALRMFEHFGGKLATE